MDEKINIKELVGGKFMTEKDGCFNVNYYEISKEEYDRVMSFDNWRPRLRTECEETLTDSIRWGYGFYGCDLAIRDGAYFYTIRIGNSCD